MSSYVKAQVNFVGPSTEDHCRPSPEETYNLGHEDSQVLTLSLAPSETRANHEECRWDVCVSSIQTASGSHSYPGKLLAHLNVNGSGVTFQLDCGAACNVLRQQDLPRNAECQPTERYLRINDGTLLKPLGTFHGTVVNPANGRMYEEDFIVVKGTPTSLLGVKPCLAMELLHFRKENVASVNRMDFGALTKDQILQKFEHLFDSNLGCFVDKPVHLELDEQVPPVKMPLRRYPIALKDKLKLERLESPGVLEHVTKRPRIGFQCCG